MSEKEKMINSEAYYSNCEELLNDRRKAKGICFEFNNINPLEEEKGQELIKKLFGKIKGTYFITAPFYCDYGYNIEIGNNFYTNHNVVILDCAKVKFGDDVFIGPNVGFYTASHPLDYKIRNTSLEYAYPITVGNNVWIGGGVEVMPGVTIGDNVVIGGGSVVTKDIPSNSLAYGNPCKVVKKLNN